jgi:hypothetical protein
MKMVRNLLLDRVGKGLKRELRDRGRSSASVT